MPEGTAIPGASPIASSELLMTSTEVGGALMSILMAPDIQPGSDLSYELAKTIYLYHPLGQKMAESPISMAQSQKREITVQDAPDEVVQEYVQQWEDVKADTYIHNVYSLSRVYGIASLVMGCEGVKSDQPLNMDSLWQRELFFNVLDPLNTSGSLVLNQIPTARDFNKPTIVRVNGEVYHRSRFRVVMNENPIYLAYTTSAFGFVGRSVYQRALYPLKSFVRTMIADDMIATKLGLLIAKQKAPSSVIDRVMAKVAGLKRSLLKQAQTGQVLSIDVDENIETLDMQNVDGAGTYSRTNILKNAATAADMPAKLLENETLVAGFGEGVEDAKNIARYIERVREKMQTTYAWFDNIVQHRTWNPEFYKRLQRQYPNTLRKVDYFDAFSSWRRKFSAIWPSLLIEPESEQIKVEDTRLQALVATVQTLLGEMDPENKARVIQWLADNINENKKLFGHGLVLDYEELKDFQSDRRESEEAMEEGGLQKLGGQAKKFGRFG